MNSKSDSRGGWIEKIPNALTVLRLIFIPLIVVIFYSPYPFRNLLCSGIFILASLTDLFDGFIARKYGVTSVFGAFLDPVADKLIVCTVLILLTSQSQSGFVIAIPSQIIICREIFISALREWTALSGNSALVAVGFQGKLKTTFQMIALVLLLYAPIETGIIYILGIICLYLSAVLTVTSAINYIRAALDSSNPQIKTSSVSTCI